ncbi:hypothetical protein BDBG_04150 [Blastomyces gilchristii SLH14081]|uniref:Uncharacterized protein n=1 Tax=Blastomyces gilchristii (strain SLH14081) TaxID=559298 RepID=A0A179UMC8_BLAGS|nr:uncharacterized protein BDBG_04150 [Blastomyces gilchristii SLH14081]OAT08171.1 hypothetical protein BDBG_04150 [Blastomyces gilchristii SLH14081]
MPDSLAAFRGTTRRELADLAREHLKHNLQQSDRDTLNSAASKLATHTTLGSIIGIGLGMYLGLRVRRVRMDMFTAFRVAEKPTHVQFANGRLEPVPDLSPMLRPTTLGDMAMFALFSAGGLFVGGESGLITGVYSARKTIGKDPESKKRIQRAFAKLRADILRRQADRLDGDQSVTEKVSELF